MNILSLSCKHTQPGTFIHRDTFYIIHFLHSCLAEFVVDDVYAVRLHKCDINKWQPSNHDKLTFLPWLFSPRICLDWSAIKTLASHHCPPLFPASPSSLRSLFGLQWNFDARPLPRYRELNMPCPDLLSAATFIPLASNAALKPSENALFSQKHIIELSSSGTRQLVVFLLYFGSALIFPIVCVWLWPCSRGKASHYRLLQATGSICFNLLCWMTLCCTYGLNRCEESEELFCLH